MATGFGVNYLSNETAIIALGLLAGLHRKLSISEEEVWETNAQKRILARY